jgi:hypothetical protein
MATVVSDVGVAPATPATPVGKDAVCFVVDVACSGTDAVCVAFDFACGAAVPATPSGVILV